MSSPRYLALRLLGLIGTLLVISALTYAVFYLLPADPARLSCGRPCTPARLSEASAFMGYDKSSVQQYLDFLAGIVAGRRFGSGLATVDCAAPCLGFSFQLNAPVTEVIARAGPGDLLHRARGGAALAGHRRRDRDFTLNGVPVGGYLLRADLPTVSELSQAIAETGMTAPRRVQVTRSHCGY